MDKASRIYYYYAFGQSMPARSWSGVTEQYRYSHNGHEKEEALFAGAQSAECWMYDSRIGRRWEMDPVDYFWQSPYATFANSPVFLADPDGQWGDPPGTITKNTKTASKLGEGNTRLDVQFKQIQRSIARKAATRTVVSTILNEAGSFLSYAGSKAIGIIGLLDNSDGYGSGSVPIAIAAPMEKITLDPSTLTPQYLLDVKARVEMGKGSFNDHQIYNRAFAPPVQAPFEIQSHHVIPETVFRNVANPLFALASQDPEFQQWMDDKKGINRLPLGNNVHTKHTAYSKSVDQRAHAMFNKLKPTTPEQAAEITRSLIGQLKGEIRNNILNNPGKTLNQIYGGGPNGKSKAQEPKKKEGSKLRSKY